MGRADVVETPKEADRQELPQQSTDILQDNSEYQGEYSDEGVFRLQT
jgi:hypothetical protein